MVPHSYINATDNLAQACADDLGRQEVTAEWYLANMCDAPLFAWTTDEDQRMGLDPWRLLDMVPDSPRRLFVQRKDMTTSQRRLSLVQAAHNEIRKYVKSDPLAYHAASNLVHLLRPDLGR